MAVHGQLCNGRASDPNQNRRQGNLLKPMLRAPNENDEDTITYVKSKYLLLVLQLKHLIYTCLMLFGVFVISTTCFSGPNFADT
jgi:hypothetical protein